MELSTLPDTITPYYVKLMAVSLVPFLLQKALYRDRHAKDIFDTAAGVGNNYKCIIAVSIDSPDRPVE